MTNDLDGARTVSIVLGDRHCAGCGFSLVGQPIVREARYGLLIARCPECGRAAPVEDYPVLGRWANRWAALAAGLYVVALLGLLIGAGAALFGGIVTIAEDATVPLSREIGGRYLDYVAERYRAGVGAASSGEARCVESLREAEQRLSTGGVTGAALPTTISDAAIERVRSRMPGWYGIDAAWWEGQDKAEVLRAAGGFRRAGGAVELLAWFWLLTASFALGVLLALASTGWPLRRAFTAGLIPLLVGALLSTLWPGFGSMWSGPTDLLATEFARLVLWSPLRAGVLGISYAGIAIGIAVGRPLVRLTLRAFLPSRLCQALACVWTADGKAPPRPAGRVLRP